ncbi:MAG: hypothetical protein ACLQUZ_17125 [Rhizomicrobium sp.]
MAANYWRGVRRQARKETNQTLFGSVGEAMIGAVGWILWLAAVFIVLKNADLKNELLIGVIAGAAPALLYPIVYGIKLLRIPPKLRAKGQRRQQQAVDRIAVLEKHLNPETELTIKLNPGPTAIGGLRDSHGKVMSLRMAFIVRVEAGKHALRNCQIKLGEYPRFAYPASKPFDLRAGEHNDVPVLYVEDDNDGRGARAVLYFLRPSDWEIETAGCGWLLGPGKYGIQVFSDDTAPTLLFATLAADINNGRRYNWSLEACT